MGAQVVNKNNLIAGVFLIGSILLAVSISFILSDIGDRFISKKEYVVRFPVDIGVAGLQSGATVTFGGLEVGKVSSIRPHQVVDAESGLPVTMAHDVVVALSSDLNLFENAYADLMPPILGGVSSVNIASAGDGSYEQGPADDNSVLNEGEIIRGRFAPAILAQLGFSVEDAKKIRDVIDSTKSLTENIDASSMSVRNMTESLEPQFIDGIDDGRSAVSNIREFTDHFNGEDGWSSRVGRVLDNADASASKLGPAIDDVRAGIKDARDIISENRSKIARTTDNIEQITERIRFDTTGQIDELLAKGSMALTSFQDVGNNVNGLIVENRPKINSTISSARDIGVDGKLFVEEIRSQPWRLLNKPTEDELAREPIYEAAKAYAGAVSDLRIASEALDAAVVRAGQTGTPESVAEITAVSSVVESAYDRYEQAEQGLLEILRSSTPTQSP
jgi:ABC-type transporter Mla subunit MlaD